MKFLENGSRTQPPTSRAEAAATKAHLVECVFKQSFCYVKGIPKGFAFACLFCFCLSLSRLLLPAAHAISSEGIDGFEEHHSCSDISNDMNPKELLVC